MAETIQPAAPAKPKRDTGDWRGWPQFMIVVCAIMNVGGVLGGFALGSENGVSGWAFFIGIECSAFALYSLTAIIAALRGILNQGR